MSHPTDCWIGLLSLSYLTSISVYSQWVWWRVYTFPFHSTSIKIFVIKLQKIAIAVGFYVCLRLHQHSAVKCNVNLSQHRKDGGAAIKGEKKSKQSSIFLWQREFLKRCLYPCVINHAYECQNGLMMGSFCGCFLWKLQETLCVCYSADNLWFISFSWVVLLLCHHLIFKVCPAFCAETRFHLKDQLDEVTGQWCYFLASNSSKPEGFLLFASLELTAAVCNTVRFVEFDDSLGRRGNYVVRVTFFSASESIFFLIKMYF